MKKEYLLICGLLLVAGCASQADKEEQWLREAAKTCVAIGHTENDAGMACMERQIDRLRQEDARSRRVMGSAISEAAQGYSRDRAIQCASSDWC